MFASISLEPGEILSPGTSIKSYVVTENGSPHILTEYNNYKAVRHWVNNGYAVSYEQSNIVSNLIALNTGTYREKMALFVFDQTQGFILSTIEFNGELPAVSAHYVHQLFTDDMVARCPVKYLTISGGFQDKVAFAGECVLGVFDFASNTGGWIEGSQRLVYSAIPPVFDSCGRAYFLVRDKKRMAVLRATGNQRKIIARFTDSKAPALDDELSEYPYDSMMVLADDSLLVSGKMGYKRVKAETVSTVSPGTGQRWGAGNMVSTSDSLLIPTVTTDSNNPETHQLSINVMSLADESIVSHTQTTLETSSITNPGYLGLVNDHNHHLSLLFPANNQLFNADTNNLDTPPVATNLDLEVTSSGSGYQETAICVDQSLLLAGSEAYTQGQRQGKSALFRLKDSNPSLFQQAIRGIWAQEKADAQRSSAVPAGVEVILTEHADRVALRCHAIGNDTSPILIPANGMPLARNSQLLSLYSHELSQHPIFITGAQCQPFSLAGCDGTGSGENSSSCHTVKALTTEPFQLQMVAMDRAIPLWATNQTLIHGGLSSSITRSESCLNFQQQCSGYKRLALGNISEESTSAPNKSSIATKVAIGLATGTVSIIAIVVVIGIVAGYNLSR